MWPFTSKPKLPRRQLRGETAQAMVLLALKGKTQPNFRLIMQKGVMSCPSKVMLRKAADQAYKTWQENMWECEDQARAVVHQAQLLAAKEGCSWAVGMLRANAPEGASHDLHVFIWAILDTHEGLQFTLFDPTTDEWADVPDLSGVDYALT